MPPIDISKAGTGDWVVLGLGALLLSSASSAGVLSLDFRALSQSESPGGWHRFWWIAPLLILAVTVVRATPVAHRLLIKEVKPLWLLYGAVAALVLYLISLIDVFILPSVFRIGLAASARPGFSAGPGFGIWASLDPGDRLRLLPGAVAAGPG